jgi:MarR family transcriptional regulator, negative regulator of the multidrug operon emrRAB
VLITLLERRDLTVESLRRIVGLTHSAGVRLVDRLVAEGLVRRRAGPDRRSVSISLTSRGRRTAARLRGQCEARLIELLEPLDEDQRVTLSAVAEKLAVRLVTGRLEARFICRLCDHGVCADAGGCPVDLAATSLGD